MGKNILFPNGHSSPSFPSIPGYQNNHHDQNKTHNKKHRKETSSDTGTSTGHLLRLVNDKGLVGVGTNKALTEQNTKAVTIRTHTHTHLISPTSQ